MPRSRLTEAGMSAPSTPADRYWWSARRAAEELSAAGMTQPKTYVTLRLGEGRGGPGEPALLIEHVVVRAVEAHALGEVGRLSHARE